MKNKKLLFYTRLVDNTVVDEAIESIKVLSPDFFVNNSEDAVKNLIKINIIKSL